MYVQIFRYFIFMSSLFINKSGCEGKAVIKKTTMAVSTESSKEREEVIVRGQGWYMRLRALGSCAHILARLAIPAFLTAYNVWLRSQRLILHHMSTHIHYALASISMTLRFQAIGVFLIETKTKLKPLLWAEAGVELQDTEEGKDIFCEVLYDPGPATQADVIFIHGLKGSLYKTWKQGLWDSNNRSDIRWTKLNTSNYNEEEFESNQDQDNPCGDIFEPDDDPSVPGEYSKCWPRDWLPLDCPGVRIIAVSYSTDPFLWKPFWISSQQRLPMKEKGREMMNELLELGVGSRPIVWVGHSKGGLFVKQMLVHAFESENPSDIALCSNSKAILFYSVPHRGSPLASIDFPLLTRSIELREVMADSLEVQYLQDKFQHLLNSNLLQVKIKSFIETKLTFMTIVYLRIVSVESADLGIGELYGVPLDHRDICKPKSRYCFLYRELVRLINSVLQHSRQINSVIQPTKQIYSVIHSTKQINSVVQPIKQINSVIQPTKEINSVIPHTKQIYTMVETLNEVNSVVQTAKNVNSVVQTHQIKFVDRTKDIETMDQNANEVNSVVQTTKNVNSVVQTHQIKVVDRTKYIETMDQNANQANSVVQTANNVNSVVQTHQIKFVDRTKYVETMDQNANQANSVVQASEQIDSVTHSVHNMNQLDQPPKQIIHTNSVHRQVDSKPVDRHSHTHHADSSNQTQDQCTLHEKSPTETTPGRFGESSLPAVFNEKTRSHGETFTYDTVPIQQVMSL